MAEVRHYLRFDSGARTKGCRTPRKSAPLLEMRGRSDNTVRVVATLAEVHRSRVEVDPLGNANRNLWQFLGARMRQLTELELATRLSSSIPLDVPVERVAPGVYVEGPSIFGAEFWHPLKPSTGRKTQ